MYPWFCVRYLLPSAWCRERDSVFVKRVCFFAFHEPRATNHPSRKYHPHLPPLHRRLCRNSSQQKKYANYFLSGWFFFAPPVADPALAETGKGKGRAYVSPHLTSPWPRRAGSATGEACFFSPPAREGCGEGFFALCPILSIIATQPFEAEEVAPFPLRAMITTQSLQGSLTEMADRGQKNKRPLYVVEVN